MTTYIDRIVTDVTVSPEGQASASQSDQRWADARKIEAQLKQRARESLRLRAEGRDD